MANYYWIKLYHEILEDPKMCRLSDRMYRRTIELFLIAGETAKDGYLPCLEDMAWKLRMRAEDLETDLVELQKTGIISMIDNEWLVTKFAERQEPVSNAERQKSFRERERERIYYGDETKDKQDSNELVTSCYTDIDIDTDKIQIRKDTDKIATPPQPEKTKSIVKKQPAIAENDHYPFMVALAEITKTNLDIKSIKGRISKAAKELHQAKYTPENITAFGDWWYIHDWRGLKKQAPTPEQVITEIGKMGAEETSIDAGQRFVEEFARKQADLYYGKNG